jgi:hypothetical protein
MTIVQYIHMYLVHKNIYTVASTVDRGDVRSQNLRSVEQIKMALPYC